MYLHRDPQGEIGKVTSKVDDLLIKKSPFMISLCVDFFCHRQERVGKLLAVLSHNLIM